MARRHEALELLRSGKSPRQISDNMQIDLWRVFNHLFTLVGEGCLLRSDIAFAIPEKTRKDVDSICQRCEKKKKVVTYQYLRRALYDKGYRDEERLEGIIYWRHLQQPEVALGDMYVWIAKIEKRLHQYIKEALMKKSSNWWRELPLSIRKACAIRLEEEPDPASEPYHYTTLIDLKEILDKNWALFSKLVPPSVGKEKLQLLRGLTELNTIRNRVMHPCKGFLISGENFEFVHGFMAFLRVSEWKLTSGSPAGAEDASSAG